MSNSQRIFAHLFLITLFLAFLAGCATPRNRFYLGEALPREKVAILKVIPGGPFDALPIIWSVDNRKPERALWDGAVEVELLPGPHVVEVGFYQKLLFGSRFSKGKYLTALDAEPGHSYEVRVTVISEGESENQWNAEIVDVESGKKFLPR